ncbi:MAG: hypothetical protein L6Q84_11285 [Polyangiaceae bacterium]|nr:hypothetical protein [Polyangiaceae bacterium]
MSDAALLSFGCSVFFMAATGVYLGARAHFLSVSDAIERQTAADGPSPERPAKRAVVEHAGV